MDDDVHVDDPRSVTRARALRAARHIIAERGLDISMDDVANAAGVGRRTLFRHFDSRDALVAEALTSALDWYDRHVAPVELDADREFDEWVATVVRRVHELHLAAGRGLWQLAASADADLPAELAAVNRRRRERRRVTTEALAAQLWRRGGGRGRCPSSVVDACALSISSFATHSMLDDYGRDRVALSRSTASMLGALVQAELAARVSRASR